MLLNLRQIDNIRFVVDIISQTTVRLVNYFHNPISMIVICGSSTVTPRELGTLVAGKKQVPLLAQQVHPI